jgi:Predicted membrane protein (DUF2243)
MARWRSDDHNRLSTSRQFPVSAGVFFGLGLGGFFDGIVLHQVLQWHHMLSNWFPVNTIARTWNSTRDRIIQRQASPRNTRSLQLRAQNLGCRAYRNYLLARRLYVCVWTTPSGAGACPWPLRTRDPKASCFSHPAVLISGREEMSLVDKPASREACMAGHRPTSRKSCNFCSCASSPRPEAPCFCVETR